MKTQFNFSLKSILIIGIIIIILFGGGFGLFNNKLNKANQKLSQQINLNRALKDSITYTINKYNEVVANKLTLQASLKELKKRNNDLTNNQKELVERIKNLKNKNNLISAALVESEVKIDSLKDLLSDSTIVNENDSTITFIENNDSLNYDITIGKVFAASKKYDPTFSINNLSIPNKQFITFEFEDEDKYYQTPIKFTISNSNPFVKTLNADSYTIPEINKDALNPSFWDKVDKFFDKPTVKIIGGAILFGGGTYVGATLF
jgi:hypothetical protein